LLSEPPSARSYLLGCSGLTLPHDSHTLPSKLGPTEEVGNEVEAPWAPIIGAVKQVEGGRAAAEVAREVGVSTHTIYAWKQKVRWAGSIRGAGVEGAAR